ncbi:MAG: type I-B CRISPR-associated protein Cas7/Csh2, partial [Syntrophorhabdus sp.]
MIERNSELLYLYDAQMCNPNGDMDNENKPREDFDTKTNLVSDVRLKRYIRDYFEQGLGKEIFITSSAKKAEDRNKQLKAKGLKHFDLIDVRIFGAVTAEKDTTEGHHTGPVQFTWGYSLHPVELVDSTTITSNFSSGQGVGKDFRLYYSLISFSGSLNANIAEKTQMTEEDLTLFDEALLKSIPFARTRSKIGQFPRLYLRVEMKDKMSFLKDLRPMVKFCPLGTVVDNLHLIRSIKDYQLDLAELADYLNGKKDLIHKIHLWADDELQIINLDKLDIGTNKFPVSL